MKTHYSEVDKANESNPHDEWDITLCGLEHTDSPVTNKIEEVTCKKCLKVFPKYNSQMKNIGENWSDYF